MNIQMKKLISLTSIAAYLGSASLNTSFAQSSTIKLVQPTASGGGKIGYGDINNFISNVIQLVFIVGIIMVLFMLIWGGVEWIMSGGDKEAVGKARGKIVNALIGLAILAVAFAIAQVAGAFIGIDIFDELKIPSPS